MCHHTAQVQLLATHCGAVFKLSYSSDVLNIDDLHRVLTATREAHAKWYYIGLGIGISPGTLDGIQKSERGDLTQCFTRMLKEWLQNGNPQPTRNALSRVLKSPVVGHADVADKLHYSKQFNSSSLTFGNCFGVHAVPYRVG